MGKKRFDWEFHIMQQARSGLSVKEYSKREGFSSWSFYINRKKLHKKTDTSKHVQKVITRSLPKQFSFYNIGSLQPSQLTVRLCDSTVLEFSNLPSEQLVLLVKTLRDTVC